LKFIRYILPGIFCLVLVVLSWPLAQASYGSANVTLKVNIIAPPSVTTNYARPIAHGRTVLHGCLISLGTASSVVVYFEWGETTEYGNTTRLRTMTRPGAFAAAIKGLNRGTAYHFRAVAAGDGTSYGSDKIFNCRECKGGVTSLTLKYNGPGPSFIEVKSKKGVVLFSGAVNQSDTFSFNGTEKDGKLGSEIKIWVNSKLATKLHTSCSQPIGPGLIVGDFEVDKGESLKGGPLCPIPTTGEPLFWKWLWWWRWW